VQSARKRQSEYKERKPFARDPITRSQNESRAEGQEILQVHFPQNARALCELMNCG